MKTSIRIAWPVTLALTLALAVSAVIAAEPGSNTPEQSWDTFLSDVEQL